MSKSKNDIAWEKIFEKYCILDKLANNERISISSTKFNRRYFGQILFDGLMVVAVAYKNWLGKYRIIA